MANKTTTEAKMQKKSCINFLLNRTNIVTDGLISFASGQVHPCTLQPPVSTQVSIEERKKRESIHKITFSPINLIANNTT
ncbi:hypothetical protein [Enterococcus cecorum]|uniref:hypothetical protein n=1 Tax=Enterococcus cecorum TaxID=44008 RepID=UPI00200A4DAE|nr:hypothetical protein [Enterococcus cecorum]